MKRGKKKVKKEADAKKSQGALLKYFSSSSGSKATLTSSAASSSSGSDSNAEEEDVYLPSKLEVLLVPPQSMVKTKSTHQKYLKHLVTSLVKNEPRCCQRWHN